MRIAIAGAALGLAVIVGFTATHQQSVKSYASPIAKMVTVANVKPAVVRHAIVAATVVTALTITPPAPAPAVQAAVAPAALPSPAPQPAPNPSPTPTLPSVASTPPVTPGPCAGSSRTTYYNDGQSEGFTSMCVGGNGLPSTSWDNFAVGLAQPGYTYTMPAYNDGISGPRS